MVVQLGADLGHQGKVLQFLKLIHVGS
jgi:hypothetical protein